MTKAFAIVCALWLHALPGTVQAYAFFGQPDANGDPEPLQSDGAPVVWPDNRVEVAMVMNFGAPYNDSMATAMQESWNSVGTRLQFREGTAQAQPCDNNDGANVAGWSVKVCGGSDFGDALAITVVTHTRRNGVWEISDTDIVLNMNRDWIPEGDQQSGQIDFRRVIIHELGHALGLEHPDDAGQQVVAIMNSRLSAINTLQQDDIDGLTRLYGGSGSSTSTVSQRDSGGADATLPLLTLLGWGVQRIRSRRGRFAAGHGRL